MDTSKKRTRPLTDDGSNKYRPACKPVEWIAHIIDNPAGKITVVAQTWFYAREKACAILGVEPAQLIVTQTKTEKDQKPATHSSSSLGCPTCSPVNSKSSKKSSCSK